MFVGMLGVANACAPGSGAPGLGATQPGANTVPERSLLVIPVPIGQRGHNDDSTGTRDAGGQGAGSQPPGRRSAGAEPAARAQLVRAVAALAQRAANGDVAAAWARTHYLLDLFDDARFRRDAHSLGLLHELADTPAGAPRQGAEATDRVLRTIAVAIDRLLAIDRLHAPAQAARVMVDFDLAPPATRAAALDSMAQLKAVVQGGGPLAANARLRLFGYCYRALMDASQAPRAQRTAMAAHCLYPLYDGDPAPHFAKPALRPPPPAWRDLVADLERLVAPVAQTPGRLTRAGEYARTSLDAVRAALAASMPGLPNLEQVDLASMPYGGQVVFYDFVPMLPAEDDADRDDDNNNNNNGNDNDDNRIAALTQAVTEDGRGRVAAAISVQADAAQVVRAGQIAAAAGATHLQILVWTEQSVAIPPGAYWAKRRAQQRNRQRVGPESQGGMLQFTRLGALDLALAADLATGDQRLAAAQSAARRARSQTSQRNPLTLYVVVTKDTWVVTSAMGVVTTIPVSQAAARTQAGAAAQAQAGAAAQTQAGAAAQTQAGAAAQTQAGAAAQAQAGAAAQAQAGAASDLGAAKAALDAALERVERAFATIDTLVLVPGAGATASSFFAAATVVAAAPRITEIVLGAVAPTPRVDTMGQRIALRANAVVRIVPATLSPQTALVRRCYQDRLEASPQSRGRFRLELRAGRVEVTQGPGDQALRDCVVTPLAPMMIAHPVTSADVTLDLESD